MGTHSDLKTLAFKVIRIRSLIAEALLNGAMRLDSEKLDRIVIMAFKTSDEVEHIAQDALSEQLTSSSLIQSLDTALFLLESFKSELDGTTSNLPSIDEIRALKEAMSTVVVPTILSDVTPVLDLHCEDWKATDNRG